LLPPWSIANGLHLKPTVKIFLSLLCILQMGVVSFAVVSPEVHELCCEDRCNANRLDSVNQQKHTDDKHHDDHEPLEEHFCPVFVYSHGITIPDVLIYNDWAYSAFKLIAFFEPNSFSPVSSALDKKQRAPPLV